MLPYISKWDTSNVENMSYMFYGCSSLNEIDEDISNWNTDKVKDITMMFTNCNSLKKVPDTSNWKICNGNKVNYMINDKSEYEVKGSKENDNLIFIPQIEEEQKLKEEEDKLKIMKLKMLDNQKKLRQQKENTESMTEQQVNKKVNNVLEDMCIYGEINKKEIINEKKNNPEKFIETSEALKLENIQ
jgi:surface protein